MSVDTGSGQVDLNSFGSAPEMLLEATPTDWYSMPSEAVAHAQLQGLRKRFEGLVAKIPVLRRFAEEQCIDEIRSIEDGALFLFPHSIYKSYPISLLEKSHFDRLTRWLGSLTSYDLSELDAGPCETIDDWIDLLDQRTDIRVIHSGGTTGKLSFLPRSVVETQRTAAGWPRVYSGFGDEPNTPLARVDEVPIIAANYRHGAMGQARILDAVVQRIYQGDESKIWTMNSGRLSADMLSLGGRLRAAEGKGAVGQLQISPKLLARREIFIKEQSEAPARRRAFFTEVASRFRGQRVLLMGLPGIQYDIATEALAAGIKSVFAPDSYIFLAGGLKGRSLPGDFLDVIRSYLGVSTLRSGYGMSEAVTTCPSCPRGMFHLQPFLVPYLLDPRSGAPFARTGTHTGRYGFIDLLAETYWGGFLTGDEVTLSWGDTEPCLCGRIGPYLHPEIRRYSELEGGDDQITCAGAPEAHDRALSFIAELE